MKNPTIGDRNKDPWKHVRAGGGGRNVRTTDAVTNVRSSLPKSALKNKWTQDSDKSLAIKAAVSVIAEALSLLGILKGAKVLSAKSLPLISRQINGIPALQWASFAFVCFGSSAVKKMLDGGVSSAASNQATNINQVPGNAQWYTSLQKPKWNPPGWVFPIMWVLISKPTQMWAVSRLFRMTASPTPYLPALAVYCTHLALGDVWNQVFFEQERIKLGTGVITVFYGMLVASTELFGTLDERAGFLMLPTLGWVTVATALQWSIYKLNPDRP